MNQWTKLSLEVATADSELAANALMEAGCGGVQIDDTQLQFDASEDATFLPRDRAEVSSFVETAQAEPMSAAVRASLRAAGLESEVTLTPVVDEDWANSWRQNFPILHIGPFQIVPSWEEAPPEGLTLRLDPGLAFGTGQHPTTFLCLEMLADEMTANPPATVFDVGCGSGILSLAAAKLNPAARIVASDFDAQCVTATIENAAENNVTIEVHEAAGAAWTSEKFDLVIANLMSDLLIRLAPELRAAVRPGGTLIVSGISSPRADEVEAALVSAGFLKTLKRERDGDLRGDPAGDYLERWAAFRFDG